MNYLEDVRFGKAFTSAKEGYCKEQHKGIWVHLFGPGISKHRFYEESNLRVTCLMKGMDDRISTRVQV